MVGFFESSVEDQPDGVERVEELVHFAVALWLVQTTWGEIAVTKGRGGGQHTLLCGIYGFRLSDFKSFSQKDIPPVGRSSSSSLALLRCGAPRWVVRTRNRQPPAPAIAKDSVRLTRRFS